MAMIEDVDDLDLIPDEELKETYLERIAGLKGIYFLLDINVSYYNLVSFIMNNFIVLINIIYIW